MNQVKSSRSGRDSDSDSDRGRGKPNRNLARLFGNLRAATCLAVAFGSMPAKAETLHDEQIWVNTTAIGPVKGRLVYFAEVQGRGGTATRQFRQLLLRPAIGWRLSDHFTAYLGYAHVVTDSSDAAATNEDRAFQQLNWTIGRIGTAAISSRTRLEERWRDDGSEMGWRLREMVRVAIPVSAPAKGRPVRALAWSETFFNLNDTDWKVAGGFDQQRSFIGAELPILKGSTLEVGYLNQIVRRPTGGQRMNHALSLTFFLRT